MEDKGKKEEGTCGHGDTGTRGDAGAQGETGDRIGCGGLGRAVIAMTAVRILTCVVPGRVTDLSDVRPPTDVMAITSLPQAATCHLK
jgi:hypothetical protein